MYKRCLTSDARNFSSAASETFVFDFVFFIFN
jgi:hypothetical protein